MIYNKLGNTDLKVSAICLGTMTWGLQNTEAEGHEQMDYALSEGVNFWDTAEMYAVPPSASTYGKTESIIGSWFKKTGRRREVILASKIAGPGLGWIRSGQNKLDRKNILAAVEDSLRRLQTDTIDLYQLHWPNRGHYHFQSQWQFDPSFDSQRETESMLEILETLAEVIKSGKIRYIGLSNETSWGTMKFLALAEKHGLPRMVSIQNEYSLLCRLFEPDLHEIAMSENCGLLAWSPLARGILSGKYLDGKRPPGTRLAIETRPERRINEASEAATRAYIALAKDHGLDPCQMALAFVNSRPFVTSNIIGATNMVQLKSNIESINIKLSQSVLDGIASIRRQYPMPY